MRALIITLALLVGACGWQLRGNLMPPLAVDSLYLMSEGEYTELRRTLERSLQNQDIALAPSQSEGAYTLAVGEETLRRRTVGVGADTLASAYELTLSVDYQLLTPKGEPVGEPATAQIRRSYDASNPTGAREQQRELVERMRIDLVDQILRRLSILLGNAPGNGQTQS